MATDQQLPPDFFSPVSNEELYNRLDHVIDFALRNIVQMDIQSATWNEIIGPSIHFFDKVVTETSLLVLLVKRCRVPAHINDKLATLGSQLAPYVRSDRNRILLLKNPQTAVVFGIGHAALQALGIEDNEFDILVKRAFLSSEVYNTERIPYRKLDVIWLHQLLLGNSLYTPEQVIPHTILAGDAHPIYMTTYDTYALTHGLMYITDFGTHAPAASVDAKKLSSVIDATLAYYLLSDNLDILGELLMATCMMRTPWSVYARMGWKLLSGTWDKLGFLPCPTFETAVYSSLPANDANAYVFKHLYHTTYVGGILACLMLQEKNETKYAVPQPTDTAIDAGVVLSQLQDCLDRVSLFLSDRLNVTLSELPENRQSTMIAGLSKGYEQEYINSVIRRKFSHVGSAGFLLSFIASNPACQTRELLTVLSDSILIHAVQEYDLPLLVETLWFVVQCELPFTITVGKAIGFVIQQQLPSGVIGAHFVEHDNSELPEAIIVTAEIAFCLQALAVRLEKVRPANEVDAPFAYQPA